MGVRLHVLYADLSHWQGEAADYGSAPCRGVLRVSVEHPGVGQWVKFSGWDHYGVRLEGARVLVGVWKTDDPDDPYFGQGMVWSFGPNGSQERSAYMPMHELPAFNATRRGQWVSDKIARSVGLL